MFEIIIGIAISALSVMGMTALLLLAVGYRDHYRCKRHKMEMDRERKETKK